MVCVILYHVIKIVRLIRKIVERIEVGSEVLAEDLEELRYNFNPARLLSFFMNFMPRAKRKRRKSDD